MSAINQSLGAITQAIQASDFTTPGGALMPKQQAAFFQYLRDTRNPFLSQARLYPMTQKLEDIDKMLIGQPITEAAPENDAADYSRGPLFGQTVRLTATKTRSSWSVTTDVAVQIIEQEQLQKTVMDKMVTRAATDFEILGVQGDADISDTDAYSKLKKINDGWGKLCEESHLVDAAGSRINYDLFTEAILRMPSHLSTDPGLRWILNPATKVHLGKSLQGRQDSAGVDALAMNVRGPGGVPFIEASCIPRDQSITGAAPATSAQVRSKLTGPFQITSTAKFFKIDVDNAGAVEVDLSSLLKNSVTKGPVHTREIAKKINDGYVAAYGETYRNVARDDGDGFLLLTSPTTGASSEIEVVTPSATSALTVLGMTAATTNGGAAAAGTYKTGTFVLFANPQQFIYGVLGGTRVYSRFEQAYDRTDVVMYNWVDFQVEELDAIVKIKNVLL